MTWLDIAVLLLWVIFLAAGARMGSLWTSACVGGGFLGAYAAETYRLTVAAHTSGFLANPHIITVALFLVGAAVVLLPGYLLSRLSSALFLGLIDGFFGLLTGAVAGFLLIAMVLLLVPSLYPKAESTAVWKKSVIVRPLEQFLEEKFSRRAFANLSLPFMK